MIAPLTTGTLSPPLLWTRCLTLSRLAASLGTRLVAAGTSRSVLLRAEWSASALILPTVAMDIAVISFSVPGATTPQPTSSATRLTASLVPFLLHALKLTTGKVALLARLALLEGQKRRALFQSTPLARVWVSSRRVSMPPGGTDIPAKGGAIAYAWFVWERGYSGAPSLGWLT